MGGLWHCFHHKKQGKLRGGDIGAPRFRRFHEKSLVFNWDDPRHPSSKINQGGAPSSVMFVNDVYIYIYIYFF